MNHMDQLLALAELDGWVFREIDNEPGHFAWHDRTGAWRHRHLFSAATTAETEVERLPNYLGGLLEMNALLERLLGDNQMLRACYLDNLALVTCGENAQADDSRAEVWAMTQASAAQKAKALLLAFGQWFD